MAKRPRYANNLQPPNLQPWPKGHATRTTFNLLTFNLLTFNLQHNNLQPPNLQQNNLQPANPKKIAAEILSTARNVTLCHSVFSPIQT
ncbi:MULTISPECIES: hypothetical protein [unclassified Moorena]|uniref:hypothetical protein n=1 Tax=unclassified Moorena TaxID=2683338 RepID=UPI0013C63EB1|nr:MULTISPECIES: hypothetical protein [unclassified Moorena]NEO21542.1 hypothetical protein [Moorena sp. SIO4A5]NEQ58830.1 hypothetical protein [Moorena sp. SIO4A1]